LERYKRANFASQNKPAKIHGTKKLIVGALFSTDVQINIVTTATKHNLKSSNNSLAILRRMFYKYIFFEYLTLIKLSFFIISHLVVLLAYFLK
jgi:hypothetical protein